MLFKEFHESETSSRLLRYMQRLVQIFKQCK